MYIGGTNNLIPVATQAVYYQCELLIYQSSLSPPQHSFHQPLRIPQSTLGTVSKHTKGPVHSGIIMPHELNS